MINKNIAWRSALVTFLSLSLSVLLPCSQAEAVDEGDSATGQKLPPEDALQVKLRTLVLPRLDLRDAALEEVVGFLRLRSRELDPEGQGVNFVITSAAMQAAQDAQITIQLSDVPLGTALEYVTSMAGVSLRLDKSAVVLDGPK